MNFNFQVLLNQIDHVSTVECISDELDVWQHCRMVTQAFNKSFVVSLFKSLHLGQTINTLNVRMAVDECEEASIAINITDYIQVGIKNKILCSLQ